ncbi:MAG: hypothetical protein APF81_16620 [Desulfosporosinus sp. BRH_c37]|nr:MAG: hypothetical protein APF81_16620 [Desulfosporosinus sp. BRH_c37]
MFFFDIDGTLFDHQSAEKAGALGFLEQRRRIINIPAERFLLLWSNLTEKYYQLYLEGNLSFGEQRRARIHELYSLVGRTVTNEEADRAFHDFLTYYKRAWVAYPDVIPCLKELQNKNIGLGIISNGDFKQQSDKLQHVGIRHFFSVFVTSGDVGYSKPDKRIFIEACARANKEPGQCFYVGDLLDTDFVGSTSAGMRGILLNRQGIFLPSSTDIPVVNNLAELIELLWDYGK